MSCKECKKNKKRNLKEQYPEQGTGGGNAGGTNSSSSGQYISGGAWDQQGPFFNSRRETPQTEVREVDITGGNGGQQYAGYTQGLSIADIPTDNQSPGNNITTTTQGNRIANPYDNDNPDPYDRQQPKPKQKPKDERDWRSPPCCRPCGGGKWKRDCGELERAPGSKKSNSTGCVYNSYSDCQLVAKSVNEQTSADNSGQYDTPAAWEAGGILTIPTSNDMVGSETMLSAPEINVMDELGDMEMTILTIDDVDNGVTGGLESLLGDVVSDDEVEYEDEDWLVIDKNSDDEEVDVDIITQEEKNALYEKYSYRTSSKDKPITENVNKIRNMIKRML